MGHILIIDRDATATHSLTEALAATGHMASVLAQNADALAWARQNRPDAIVLAVELPGVSGYAICNRLKKDDELRHIPLLLASEEATEEVFAEHRRLKTRADGYLFKPYDAQAVQQALQQALRQLPEARSEAARARAADTDDSPDAQDAPEDPLMSTDALLLLEGSVDVNKHTQVIRLPLGARGEQAKDLIGAALADMDSDAMSALLALEARVEALEATVRSQASHLERQQALVTQLNDALARSQERHGHAVAGVHEALRGSMQLCLDAVGKLDKTP